jgi:F0F1-type ATP synthase membrane subunit c/vacuolar-type H+-ATPase subunit K
MQHAHKHDALIAAGAVFAIGIALVALGIAIGIAGWSCTPVH